MCALFNFVNIFYPKVNKISKVEILESVMPGTRQNLLSYFVSYVMFRTSCKIH